MSPKKDHPLFAKEGDPQEMHLTQHGLVAQGSRIAPQEEGTEEEEEVEVEVEEEEEGEDPQERQETQTIETAQS